MSRIVTVNSTTGLGTLLLERKAGVKGTLTLTKRKKNTRNIHRRSILDCETKKRTSESFFSLTAGCRFQ
jgi:hypothetical protein